VRPIDDSLEALPVEIDGVEVSPQRVASEWRWADLFDPSGAARAGGDAPLVTTTAPWAAAGATTDVPTGRPGGLRSAFSRMFALSPAKLASLDQWWERRACDDRVEIARRLLLERPRPGPAGTWRVRGRLKSPWRARWIPVELLLWPRLDAWTKLSVEPQRGVHVGRSYFRSGHRVLDSLSDQLIRELVPHH
jgi:hypothetical protein